MWNAIGVILTVIVFLVVIELLALPDWIGKKLRGESSNKEMEEKVRLLESRVSELEKKVLGR